MQMLKQIRHYFFLVLVLFFSVNMVFAETGNPGGQPCVNTEKKSPAAANAFQLVHIPASADDIPVIGFNSNLTGALSVTQVLPTVPNSGFKRVQGCKDLLMLHSASLNAAFKVLHNTRYIYTDRLNHISLFLFPYHFYW